MGSNRATRAVFSVRTNERSLLAMRRNERCRFLEEERAGGRFDREERARFASLATDSLAAR